LEWRTGSVHNPIVPGYKLMKDEDGVKVDKTYYKQVVGSLMPLTVTRPDMMFVVILISRCWKLCFLTTNKCT